MEFTAQSFDIFNKEWAIVCAGEQEHYNAMTISWGGLGTLWGKPVVTVYVKPVRYTYQFMNDSEYFTVSFYDEQYRNAMQVYGSTSGRNTDKEAVTGFVPVKLEHGVTYEQAKVTLVCRKIYYNDLVLENIPEEVVQRTYTTEAPHRMFIGEVIDVIRK